jgi:hypothetical protein
MRQTVESNNSHVDRMNTAECGSVTDGTPAIGSTHFYKMSRRQVRGRKI